MTHTSSAELIQWMAQTVHQAHHFNNRTFWSCPQSTCRAAAEHLRELRAKDERNATDPEEVLRQVRESR